MIVNSPHRILMIRPSALGDVARTVPALVSLKRAFPAARIDWLVNEPFAQAISSHPDLNEALLFPRNRFRGLGALPKILAYLRELRGRRYDRVYDLQGLARSGWLARATVASHRVGPADARELGWLGYNKRIRIDPAIRHTVDRMLAVLEGDGIPAVRDMRLYCNPDDQAWAAEWLHRHQLAQEPFAVLAPGAQWLSKCWPSDRYRQLAERLGDFGMKAVAIVGSSADTRFGPPVLNRPAASGLQLHNLIGQTRVGQLMALIEKARLVIANDSAALHLAVGLGTRCLGLFGPTDPARVGPYRLPDSVACGSRPSDVNYRAAREDQSIMATLTVDQAAEGVRRVLNGPAPATQW